MHSFFDRQFLRLIAIVRLVAKRNGFCYNNSNYRWN